MKKTAVTILCALLAISVCGCRNAETNTQPSAKSLMEDVNSKNILSNDVKSRIWYAVEPKYFADGTQSGTGDFYGLLARLGYLNDGNPSTMDDLNMGGLLLMDAVYQDDARGVVNYTSINPEFGGEEALTSLCQSAGQYSMPVMIRLNLKTISKTSEQFLALESYAASLPAETPADGFDPYFKGIFRIDKDRQEDNWIQIGQTPWYYQAEPGTDTPLTNAESDIWKNEIAQAVNYYLSLGVSGFLIEEADAFFPGDAARNRDLVNWFSDCVRSQKPDACIVAASSEWPDEMHQINASHLDAGASGIQGMLAKAVTGTISARELGTYLTDFSSKSSQNTAWQLNEPSASLDLLKSQGKAEQYKIALALEVFMSGQVFITAGDELGLSSSESDLISEVIDGTELSGFSQQTPNDAGTDSDDSTSGSQGESNGNSSADEQNGEEPAAQTEVNLSLEFGNLEEQRKDGNSIFSFLQQALLLRNSYSTISSGNMEMIDSLSTDTVLFLKKSTDKSECVLVFNFSDKKAEIDLGTLTISGLPPELGGILLSGEQTIALDGQTLTMPAYSAAVLK